MKSLAFAMVVALAGLLGSATQAAAAERLTGFAVGDTVVVTWPEAQLLVGNQEVAQLGLGARAKVTEIRGPWLGIWVESNGKAVGGWLQNPLERSTRRFAVEPSTDDASPVPSDNSVPFGS